MAIIYLGRNNQAKKINSIYVGINDQSKRVILGYIGVNGNSKIFYDYRDKDYPTLLEIHNVHSIYLNYPLSSTLEIEKWDENNRGKIQREPIDDYNIIYVKTDKFYLNSSSQNFFYLTEDPIFDSASSQNIEDHFLFDKVTNLAFFSNRNINADLTDCNFDSIINMHKAFTNDRKQIIPKIGNNVIDMSYAYYNCYLNRRSSRIPQLSGPEVTNMSYAYYNSIRQSTAHLFAHCGPNVINMSHTYDNCTHLYGTPACGDKVTNLSHAYEYSYSYNYGENWKAKCGSSVIDMSYAYAGTAYINEAVCGPNVTNMSYAYDFSLVKGTAACGPNVTNMSFAYNHSTITTAVCGAKVINMADAYHNSAVTGTAACGANVTDMSNAYRETRITTPVCGAKVTNMYFAYYNCGWIDAVPCTKSVVNLYRTYSNCNIQTEFTMKFYGDNISRCFQDSYLNYNINIYAYHSTVNIKNMFNNITRRLTPYYPTEIYLHLNSQKNCIKVLNNIGFGTITSGVTGLASGLLWNRIRIYNDL